MVTKYGVKWSREETILAFELYCRTSYSKISPTNDEVIKLANLFGRTPNSVAMKMFNLAHFDPAVVAQKKSGMSNASKLDKEIVEEFNNNFEELSFWANKIMSDFTQSNEYNIKQELLNSNLPEGFGKVSETKIRIGQEYFRKAVLIAYGNKCCVTGINKPELLIASHIKPWKDSNPTNERTNPRNGLCLNAFHDKAFDKGFITLDKNYKIIISKHLKDVDMDAETRDWFYSYSNKEIVLPDKFVPDKHFIEYHNDNIFKG